MTNQSQSIRKATPASQVQQPQVEFRPDDYSALIGSKGYDCVIEKAVRCPCQGDVDSAKPNCQNCMGTGFIFINPIFFKPCIHGKYKVVLI